MAKGEIIYTDQLPYGVTIMYEEKIYVSTQEKEHSAATERPKVVIEVK